MQKLAGIIPPTAADWKHKQELGLPAVNGSPIPTYGTRSITLDLGLRRVFRWIFIVADIQTPILGADFHREYGLLVNLRQGHLLDATTSLQSKGIIYHIASPSPSLTQLHNTEYHAILTEFPSVTKPCTSPCPVRFTVTYHIWTTGPPVHTRACRLLPDQLRIARNEFKLMMEQGIIQPSASQWSSPSTWSQIRHLVTGDLVETTEL